MGDEEQKTRLEYEYIYGCGQCRAKSPRVSYMAAKESRLSSLSYPYSFITSISSLSPLQNVDVLELIGSAFVFYCSHTECHYGIPFLKEALVLHQTIDVAQSVDQMMHTDSTTCNALDQLEEAAGDYQRLLIHAFKISQGI